MGRKYLLENGPIGAIWADDVHRHEIAEHERGAPGRRSALAGRSLPKRGIPECAG